MFIKQFIAKLIVHLVVLQVSSTIYSAKLNN